MDLAKDILNLGEKVAQVPGLSTACSLAFQIITTVQISKNNTARLQYLAHFIADHLVSIAECMRGRWDDAPGKFKEHLDEYEAILRQVSKMVAKCSKSSRVLALINAGDYEKDIARLEKKMADVQRSILLLISLNNSLVVNQIEHLGRETHSVMLQLVDAPQNRKSKGGFLSSDEFISRTYTRDDIRLVRKICSNYYPRFHDRSALITTLHQAERCADGRLVLVRTYGGHKISREQAFVKDLAARADLWDSSILQLVGTSRPSENMPFQVYHVPSGQLEYFEDWANRTLHSNPVETILGLYEMRTSIRDILEFQRRHNVKGVSNLLRNAIVSVQSCKDRLERTLVYAGELSNGNFIGNMSTYEPYRFMNADFYWGSELGPASALAASFCGGSKTWAEDTRDLGAIVRSDIDSVDIHTLTLALFENEWFGTSSGLVVQAREDICLGDVGYIHKNEGFVVIDNFHSRLTSRVGSTPSWSRGHEIEDLKECKNGTTVVERSGKPYNRYECAKMAPCLWGITTSIQYADIDERHAWRLLQQDACDIVHRNGLSIAPHELTLITSVEKFLGIKVWIPDRPLLEGSEAVSKVGLVTQTSGQDSSASEPRGSLPTTVYIFQNGDPVNIGELGVLEHVVKLRPSLEAEPNWLDCEEAWSLEDGQERRDEVELEYFFSFDITYLQLPPGVAVSCITEFNYQ